MNPARSPDIPTAGQSPVSFCLSLATPQSAAGMRALESGTNGLSVILVTHGVSRPAIDTTSDRPGLADSSGISDQMSAPVAGVASRFMPIMRL
jgi:hypothetical protein